MTLTLHTYQLVLVEGDPRFPWPPDPPHRQHLIRPLPFEAWCADMAQQLSQQQLAWVTQHQCQPTPFRGASLPEQQMAWLTLASPLAQTELHEALTTLFNRFCVDWALQSDAQWHTPKRLVLSDMDSTLVQGECIDELAVVAGCGDAVAHITAQAMQGELNFEEALTQRVALLKGLSMTAIDEVLEHTPLMPGASTLMEQLGQQGVYRVLVSGGFTPFTQAVCQQLGMDAEAANELGQDEATHTLNGKVLPPILGKAAKLHRLKQEAERLGIGLEQTIAIGDGANDLAMIQAAGLGVAFHAKPLVRQQAAFCIHHTGLETVLYYLGIGFIVE